jgi:hypothetical protein
VPEYSSEAIAAAQELNAFADYIRDNYWGGRSAGKATEAISAAAKSRASSILAQSSIDNAQREGEEPKDLQHELSSLLNRYSAENASGTPDFLLAELLLSTLYHYEDIIQKRAAWRGETVDLPSLKELNTNSEVAYKAEPDVKLSPLLSHEAESTKKGFFGGPRRA